MINWNEIILTVEGMCVTQLTDGQSVLVFINKMVETNYVVNRVVDMLFWSLVNQKPIFSTVTKVLVHVIHIQSTLVNLSSTISDYHIRLAISEVKKEIQPYLTTIREKIKTKSTNKHFDEWNSAYNLLVESLSNVMTPSSITLCLSLVSFLRNFRPLSDTDFIQLRRQLERIDTAMKFHILTEDTFSYTSWIKSIISSMFERLKSFDFKTVDEILLIFKALSSSIRNNSKFDNAVISELDDKISQYWMEAISRDFVSNAKLSSIHFNHITNCMITNGLNFSYSTLYGCGKSYKSLQNSLEVCLSKELYNLQLPSPTLFDDHINVLSIIGFENNIEQYFRYVHENSAENTLDHLSDTLFQFVSANAYSFYRREFYELRSDSKYLAKEYFYTAK